MKTIAKTAGTVRYIYGAHGKYFNLRVDAGDVIEPKITFSEANGRVIPAYLDLTVKGGLVKPHTEVK